MATPRTKIPKKPSKDQDPITKKELDSLVESYLAKGNTIKKCGTKHATGAYRGSILTGKK